MKLAIKETEESLRLFSQSSHHFECVCLSTDYSLSTRVLNADYSPWIIKRILAKEFTAIEDFVWIINKALPPPGMSERLFPRWEENIRSNVSYLLKGDFTEYIQLDSVQADIELRTALILGYLRTGYDGFTLTLEVSKYITMIMLAHKIQFINYDKLLSACKSFVLERIEWEKAIVLNESSNSIWSKKYNTISNESYNANRVEYSVMPFLQPKLKNISPIPRVHLFSLAGFRKTIQLLRPVNSVKVYHQIKYWGLNVNQSSQILSTNGFVVKSINGNTVTNQYDYEFEPSLINEFIECSKIYFNNLLFIELFLSFGLNMKRFGSSNVTIQDLASFK